MGIEIERKFLVTGDDWRTTNGVLYRQGYLNRDKRRTVRIRIAGPAAFLTIKGISDGPSRAEFEYVIPLDDAVQLLKLCDGPLIEKIRHIHHVDEMTWEVDEFLGENQGLVVAEIELDTPDQTFTRPDWLGEEVTDDPRYFNSSLSLQSFQTWIKPARV